MSRGLYALLFAQFLTAFGDNAILFAVIAIAFKTIAARPWYVPALQGSFLVAYVVLAPWVGTFADHRSKRQVLIIGNALKAAGTLALLFGVEPLLSYGFIGVGAAVYAPAKYGILPELVDHTHLVKANAWIEGSTIVSILVGTVIGARIADHSIPWAIALVFIMYGLSMLTTMLVPHTAPVVQTRKAALPHFLSMIKGLVHSNRARFSMLGVSIFWAVAAVLRVLLVAWAPVVLLTKNTSDIANLTLFIAIGIVLGAIVAPRLIPLEKLRRARLAAYALGACIFLFGSAHSLWPARVALLLIGLTGGIFVVPINAALQEIGYHSIGSGGVIAVQEFFQNVFMMVSVGLYTVVAAKGVSPVNSILVLGVIVFALTFLVTWRLPPRVLESSDEL